MNFPGSRYIVWAILFVPLGVFCWQYVSGVLFYGEFIHITGDWSARLLILTLLVTPLRRLMPQQRWTIWLLRQRRYFGVAAFAYAVPHLVAYLAKLGNMARILSEGIEPGMLTGWVAMLIFTALAITSNNASVRKLGKRWKVLHRFVYAAAVLTFLHWILLAFDPLQGYLHAGVLVVIQVLRFLPPRSRDS
jgi:sulfoxide reductase heme-binding subunit YedZ